uniref:CD99 molecule (Xg blood group) n=1 Tax=Canis lupus familiaris TaxID=9615 RepID=A0A8I3S357_CANLF
MARRAAVALLLLGLLGTLRPARGQDFDLSDALGDNDKKPTAPPKKPSPDDDGFSLEDALGGGGNNDPVPPNPPKPKPNPNPNQPGSSGGFSDSDLVDGASDGGGGGGGGGGSQRPDGEEQADSPGVVPGIIGAVVVAVAGAISSFIAYQKKKLCFKENADQGDTSTKNQQSTNAEQPVDSSGKIKAWPQMRLCDNPRRRTSLACCVLPTNAGTRAEPATPGSSPILSMPLFTLRLFLLTLTCVVPVCTTLGR